MNRSRSFCSTTYALALPHTLSLLLLLFIANSLAAATGISLVQHKGQDAGTNTTASANFPSANTAGNFIAVAIRGGLSSSQVFTVKDSNGNTYKKAVQIGFTASAVTSAIFYAENIKGGANTVTVSMTVNAPLRFAILEYSGVATSNSLDATAAATATGSAASSGNTTTAASGDLLLGSVSTVNGATFTAGAGYVIRDFVPNGSGAKVITEDRIQAAAGTASATATLAASDTWGALLAAFKPAGGVAVPSITNLSPTSGPAGTSVTITGTNFGASQGTSTVVFNGTTGGATTWSNTSIVVPVPSGATSGNVVVTVGGQASHGVAFTVLIPPGITSLSPTAGPVGTALTITGNNFGASQGSSTVSINGTAATATSWSATSIVTFVPNGATSGNVVVKVGSLASNGVAFSVTPSINSITPASGPAGTSVTITGTNFGQTQGTSSVMFGSSTATVTGWSNTSVVAIVPGNLSAFTNVAVQIVVSGAASNAVNFAIAPSITSINPASGPVGTSVTITGTSFGAAQGSSTVSFGRFTATPTSWNATAIVAPVPAGATTGNVIVTVNGIASNGVAFTVIPPSITSLSPNAGAAGTVVTITGANFGASQGTSQVAFNGTSATPTSWSDTNIVVPVPAGASTGSVVVAVGGILSNGVTFTVPPPPPSIASLSPTSGPVGTSVTIAGGNWGPSQGTSTVTFNGTSATPTNWSAGAIVVPVPAGATTGNVVVTFGGVASNGVLFTVSPAITGLSSTSGPVGASVTISGTNFGTAQQGSSVAFNGIFGTPTSWSPTSIVVPVPNGASSGNVVVAVANAGASNGVLFTVTPFISGLNPFSGDTGTPITISGSNFGATQGTSTVTFNGSAAIPTSWSDTSIVAPVPSGATTGNILVRVGGFASNGASFTVAPDNTPPTAPSNLTATASSAGEVDLYWAASTDNVGVSGYQVERCQGTGCTNFTLFSTVPEPNGPTSMSDVSVVGSTSYSYRVRATDAAGNLSSYSNTATATTPGAANITSLNPASGPVGTSVTITGTGFGPGQVNSTVSFNGTPAFPTTNWSDTSILVPVPNGATTGNVVVTVGSLPSNSVNFTVTPPPPPPSITTLSPSFAVAGGASLTVTVTGTGFVSSSTVQWNGNPLATTFVSSTQLQATVTSSNIISAGAAKVTVSNTSAGGVSNSFAFFVGRTGGSNFATIVVNQAAQDIVYDPKNEVFYLSVPGTASINPNTIAVLDPTFAAITSTQPAGSNPNVLAISDDSQFLYAGIDGSSTVQRFVLPGLAPDISYSLGTSQYYGPYFALDLQVAPKAPHTLAVTLGNSGVSPRANGGITIFDDATARPTKAPGFGGTGNLFDSHQWGPDAGTLFASNTESTGLDFYMLAVNPSGVTLNQDFPNTFTRFGDNIHFDPGTNLVYSDEGHVINPSTGLPAGNFNATGVAVVDSTLNAAFFASGNASSSVTIQSFDLTHFTLINTVTIPNATGTPLHLIRWGQNGLAFISKNANGTSQVVLLGGDFVTAAPPFAQTPPPAPVLPPAPGPNAPTITTLIPSSAITGSGPFVLNVTGTQFDPAAAVQFNGSALSTTYVSSTQLQALVPASEVVNPGSAIIVVANPAAIGGSSAGATFFVGSTGGTSSSGGGSAGGPGSPGAGFAFQVVNQVSRDIRFDRVSQRFYLSVPNLAADGNTIAVLDPVTTTIVGQQFAGSNPNILSISDDGQFIYVGLDGSSSVQRFILPGLVPDISYSLGAASFGGGPFHALDLQVAPGLPHTTAVTLAVSASSPSAQGGITIFDDTAARPTIAKGFGPGGGGSALYDSLQWGVDATALFAANYEDSGFDFYTLSVTSGGVSLMRDFQNTFSSYYNKIHFDPGTNFVYSDDGHAVNPSMGASVGTFPIPWMMQPIMVPDSGLNLAFYAGQAGNSSIAIYSFNLSTFAPVSSITIPNVNGSPIRLVRWGQNGLAFNTDAGQIVLVGGNFVH